MKHSELGRDKNIIGLTERQMVFFSAKQLKTEVPVFINLQECIGVVIFMKDGSLLCYHKFGLDGMKSFRLALEKLKIKGEDVDKIELFGGALNDVVFPRVGDRLIVREFANVAEDGKKGVPSSDDRIFSFVIGRGGGLNIAEDFFTLAQDENFLTSKRLHSRDIASAEKSKEYDMEVRNLLADKNSEPELGFVWNEHYLRAFDVTAIENFVGYRNRVEVLGVLQRSLEGFDVENKTEHRYVKPGSNVGISNGCLVFPREFLANGYEDAFHQESPFSSDTEDDIYNPVMQSNRYALEGPFLHYDKNINDMATLHRSPGKLDVLAKGSMTSWSVVEDLRLKQKSKNRHCQCGIL